MTDQIEVVRFQPQAAHSQAAQPQAAQTQVAARARRKDIDNCADKTIEKYVSSSHSLRDNSSNGKAQERIIQTLRRQIEELQKNTGPIQHVQSDNISTAFGYGGFPWTGYPMLPQTLHPAFTSHSVQIPASMDAAPPAVPSPPITVQAPALSRGSNWICQRCGLRGHSKERCRESAEIRCTYPACTKIGHKLRACRMRKRDQRPGGHQQQFQMDSQHFAIERSSGA